jgi:hypothetical protein
MSEDLLYKTYAQTKRNTADLTGIANQWQTWIPTLTWSPSIPIDVTTIAKYKVIGKTVFVQLYIKSIDGNGATGLRISLPGSAIPKNNNLGPFVPNTQLIGSTNQTRHAKIRDDGINNDIYFYSFGSASAGSMVEVRITAFYEIV